MFFYPDFKPTVMALHGSASTAKQWAGLADRLSRSATFIAPDLPGYGAAQHAEDDRLDTLIRCLSGRTAHIHLIAHSFGGTVALKLANALPGRVASITLYEPVVALPDAEGQPALPLELADIRRSTCGGSDVALMAAFLDFWGGHGRWERLNASQRSRLKSHASGLRRDLMEVASGRWSDTEVNYRGPITLFGGTRSPDVVARMMRAIAADFPQTVCRRIEGLDHLAPLTRPDVVNELFCQALISHGADIDRPANLVA